MTARVATAGAATAGDSSFGAVRPSVVLGPNVTTETPLSDLTKKDYVPSV